MKVFMTLLAAIALALPLAASAADPAHQRHDTGTNPVLHLNDGKKWATDEPLRVAMTSIRTSTASALAAVHVGKMSTADYEAFGKNVNARIAQIVQTCKLAPEADGQLHLVLARMIDGVDAATGKAGDADRAHGVMTVAHALDDYGKYFVHAGWKPVLPAH